MFKKILKVFITLCAVAVALLLCWVYWHQYLLNPWTRDGQVQAYVVGVAARVSGPMIDVPVQDNQFVKQGDLLFAIDPTDYEQDVAAAQAALRKASTMAEMLRLEVERRTPLLAKQLVSLEDYQILQAKYAEAQAQIEVTQSQLSLAELNLGYTRVYAPVDGYVTNLVVTTGTYVTEGQPLLALVDADNFWVTGYFRETDLEGVEPGKRAVVRFMGHRDKPVEGVVQSVGWGIFRSDGAEGQNLLPVVAPTVDWVRLAQRFPVRIHLTNPPANLPLRVGTTASVMIMPDKVVAGDPAPDGTRMVVDGRGDPVSVPLNPQRIISLAPSTTELVFALGAGDRLIADTEFCRFPPEAQELPHIQGFDKPNAERLLELQPDLILASDITSPATANYLRGLGLNVVVLTAKGLDGLSHDIELLGNVLGRGDDAADILAEFARVRTELQARFALLSEEERPRVFLAYGDLKTYTAGPGTFPDQMILAAGGQNVAHDAEGEWVEFSLEKLVERDPQVILITGELEEPLVQADEQRLQQFRDNEVWGKFSAVRDGRVYVIDNALFNIPGPRLTLALQVLADALHPSAAPKAGLADQSQPSDAATAPAPQVGPAPTSPETPAPGTQRAPNMPPAAGAQ